GTGNMEMVLDRKLSEKRVFPAIDIPKSGTRRDDLLLEPYELEAINMLRKAFNGLTPEEAVEKCLDIFVHTKNNVEFIEMIKKIRI
ncbi:MAG: transcription termination factor Rho, partial [Lachnospiraceae bacterium]|nr:transcription termination factor Rho [Lachnospiraceae bacterium]